MKKTLLALALTLVVTWLTVKFILFAAWQAQTFFATLPAAGQWAVVGAQVLIGVAAIVVIGLRIYRKRRGN